MRGICRYNYIALKPTLRKTLPAAVNLANDAPAECFIGNGE